ncbi:hypothetical protein OFN60_39350, partial [Escherichia coli]|nr:hypothetical protein [Escherichia coli]
RIYDEHFALLRAVVEVAGYDEEIGRFWRELMGRFVEASRERLEREVAEGRAPALPSAQEAAFALVWMTERSLYQKAGRADPE